MTIKKNKKVSILIPVYNEETTIRKLIESIAKLKLPYTTEVIVVNDNSTDKTLEKLLVLKKRYKNMSVHSHSQNLGKGSAIKTAVGHSSGDILVIQDADLEYPAENILPLLAPIITGRAMIVYGSRKLNKNNKYSSYIYYLGGAFLDILIKTVLNLPITDPLSGPKAFRRTALKRMGGIRSRGFEIDTELTVKAAKNGIKITEIPIVYHPRTHAQGKKIRWFDSFPIFWVLIKSLR